MITSLKAIPPQATATREIIQSLFAQDVAGVYLYGSSVAGGLKAYSDIDVFVILHRRTIASERQELVARLLSVSGKVGNAELIRPLEVTVVSLPDFRPLSFPPRAEFIYGEWLREEFENGKSVEPYNDPDLVIVIKTVRESSVTLYGKDATELLDLVRESDLLQAIAESLPNLLATLQGDERNVILTLARIWFTASTGRIVPKDEAADWVQERLTGKNVYLLQQARLEYLNGSAQPWSVNSVQVKALVGAMTDSIKMLIEDKKD